jgi:hypothetical protein
MMRNLRLSVLIFGLTGIAFAETKIFPSIQDAFRFIVMDWGASLEEVDIKKLQHLSPVTDLTPGISKEKMHLIMIEPVYRDQEGYPVFSGGLNSAHYFFGTRKGNYTFEGKFGCLDCWIDKGALPLTVSCSSHFGADLTHEKRYSWDGNDLKELDSFYLNKGQRVQENDLENELNDETEAAKRRHNQSLQPTVPHKPSGSK